MQRPRFLDSGESALVVEFGSTVDPHISARVLALDAAMTRAVLPGVRETVPTYRSLMVHYDPLRIGRAELIEAVTALDPGEVESAPGARWTLPCCYEGAYGEEVAQVAEVQKLTPDEVVRLHSGATFRAYMYGFAPGFCYLGGLPEALGISRRATPRPPHPAGATLIAGGLAIIATFSMPTGWWVLGRTPERLFAPERETPFLVAVGDEIRFSPIPASEFPALAARTAAGEIVARRESLL
jgi:inhibitor of KinA